MSQDLEPGWTLLEIEPGNILGVYSFIVSDDDGLRCLSMDHNHPAGPFKQFGSNSLSLFFMKCQLFVNTKKIFMTQKRQFSLSMIGLFEKSIIVFVKKHCIAQLWWQKFDNKSEQRLLLYRRKYGTTEIQMNFVQIFIWFQVTYKRNICCCYVYTISTIVLQQVLTNRWWGKLCSSAISRWHWYHCIMLWASYSQCSVNDCALQYSHPPHHPTIKLNSIYNELFHPSPFMGETHILCITGLFKTLGFFWWYISTFKFWNVF